ncbi:MAG: hypothetical protein CM1200mP40_28160 [Gammaproteobacteria bacterium]|nr:MAG: hypothetical protein CM1200mP40_28160 [Gammaproteobacteria bacterium]
MYAEVDIYPEDKEAFVYGRYTLQNNFNEPISELHFTIPPNITQTHFKKFLIRRLLIAILSSAIIFMFKSTHAVRRLV